MKNKLALLLVGGAWLAGGLARADITINTGTTITGTLDTSGYFSYAYIGSGNTNTGSVAINSGGYWIHTGTGAYLYVGSSGTGYINITNSGSMFVEQAYIGRNNGSFGHVTIGNSGVWSSIVTIVGNSGTGYFDTTVGGTALFNAIQLGAETNGIGWASVSGVWSGTGVTVGTFGTGYLDINAAGFVQDDSSFIAYEVGSFGQVTVRGTGVWETGYEFAVGVSGTGYFNITDSGTVFSTNGAISGRRGVVPVTTGSAFGHVTVSGSGVWHNSEYLFVGYAPGTAYLDIGEHGLVSSDYVFIGGESIYYRRTNVTGSVSVSGTGALLSSGGIHIGSSGTGYLDITDSGSVQNGFATLGVMATAFGHVTVRGFGVWNNTDILYLGSSGSGQLDISQHGTVLSAGGIIAFGSVTVSDTGVWLNSMVLRIVGGFLDITDSGSVQNGEGLLRDGGSVTVRGSGAWTNTASLYIGVESTGFLDISNSGSVHSDTATVGSEDGGGHVTVTDAGVWDIAKALVIGNYGLGSLDISGSGLVRGGSNARIGGNTSSLATGSVSVRQHGLWDISSGTLLIGPSGTAYLDITDSGTVLSAGGIIGGHEIAATYSSKAVGQVTVSETGFWLNTGDLYVGYGGTRALLSITDHGTVQNTNAYIGYYRTVTGSNNTVTVAGSGLWHNTGTLTIGYLTAGFLDIAGSGTVLSAASVVGYDPSNGTQASGHVSVREYGLWDSGDILTLSRGGAVSYLDISNHGTVRTGTIIVGGHYDYGQHQYGASGTGYLTITDYGVMETDFGIIGQYTGDYGSVTISGSGFWRNTGDLYVSNYEGYGGKGDLNISESGSVQSSFVRVGNWNTGSAAISGTGLLQTISDGLYVGAGGNGYLTITERGSVQAAGNSGIGHNSSNIVGRVDIYNSGSWINESGKLDIGYLGAGYLNLYDRALMQNTDGYIGGYWIGRGYVTVSGSAYWNNTGTLFVGYGGTGALTITESGSVRHGMGVVGAEATATGSVSVDGKGWWGSGSLIVGNSGTGYLTITGGTVQDFNVVIGNNANSFGRVSVSGSGAWINSGSRVYVGYSGTGYLDISGVTVDSAGLFMNEYIGYDTNSYGSATVTDSGYWQYKSLSVGESGTGYLTITNSGSVVGGSFDVGGTANGFGHVTVSNNSLLDSHAGFTHIGYYSTGYLDLIDSTFLSNNANIAANQGSFGSVTVSGSGFWHDNGNLIVGQTGTGYLTITDSGSVHVSSVVISLFDDAYGNVTVNENGFLEIDSTLTIGRSSPGYLDIDDNGIVVSTGVNLGYWSGGTGNVTVSGHGLWDTNGQAVIANERNTGGTVSVGEYGYWDIADTLYVSNSGRGSLTITDSGSVTASAAYVGVSGTGDVTVQDRAYWLAPSLTVGESSLTVGGVGTVTVSGGTVSSTVAWLGSGSRGRGTVTVGGSGRWVVANTSTLVTLSVGSSGTGTLNINGGGVVQSNHVAVGFDAGAKGEVNVSGSGYWDNTGHLSIGHAGAGYLAVGASGSVRSEHGYIASSTFGTAATSGTVFISDAGYWDAGEVLSVGLQGSGYLEIAGYGAVHSGSTFLGGSTTYSIGRAFVGGDGGVWTIDEVFGIGVGGSGTGALTVTGHGVVNATGTHGVILGSRAGGDSATGSVSVGDWGFLDTGGGLWVGNLGVGNLGVLGSGSVRSVDGVIGSGATGSGSARVAGAAGRWDITETLRVGNNGGAGVLDIAGGGVVTSATGLINGGTVNVSGSGFWDNSETLQVAGGYLGLDGSGSVHSGSAIVGAAATGSARVAGDGWWENDGVLWVGYLAAGVTPTLDITGRGTVRSGSAVIGYYGGGAVTVSGTGLLEVDHLHVGQSGTGALTVTEHGTVNSATTIIGVIGDGSGTVSGTGVWNAGQLTVGYVSGTGRFTITDSGTVNSGITAIGSINSSGSAIVRGTGVWHNDILNVGHLSGTTGTSALTITERGTVHSGTAHIGNMTANARVTVSGSGFWEVDDVLTVGILNGDGELDLSASGSVQSGDFVLYNGVVNVSGTSLLTVTGTGEIFEDGTIAVGVLGGTSALTITERGTVRGNWFFIGLSGNSDNLVTVSGSGFLDGLMVALGGGVINLTDSGSVQSVLGGIDNGQATIRDNAIWRNSGTIDVPDAEGFGGFILSGENGPATLSIRDSGSLAAGYVYTQTTANNLLDLTLTNALNSRGAFITADRADLTDSGTLQVTAANAGTVGFSGSSSATALTGSTAQLLIATGSGITGDFARRLVSGGASTHDFILLDAYQSGFDPVTGLYRNYVLGGNLAWFADISRSHGTFTLGAGETFDVDVNLSARSGNLAGSWDGRTLTKQGAGTLILSGSNVLGGLNVRGGRVINRGWISDDLTVDGPDDPVYQNDPTAYLTATNAVIGEAAGGVFIIDGGTVSIEQDLVFGQNAGSHGSGTFNGAVEVGNDLYVGRSGSGALTVTGGMVRVSGTDDSAMSGNLYVGYSGSGYLAIAGGTVGVEYAKVGENQGSIGTATVSGFGVWDIGELSVGASGIGYLDLIGSGTVLSGAAAIGSDISLLGYGGSFGHVTVSGSGVWSNTGVLHLGPEAGTGYLDISGHGLVGYGDAIYLGGIAGTGSISVSGTGALLGSNMEIGSNTSGTGYLNITDSGSVQSTAAIVGHGSYSFGQVTVGGTGVWNNTGNLILANSGGGRLDISGRGRVIVGQNYTQRANSVLDLTLDGTLNSRGAFVEVGGNADLTNAGTLAVTANAGTAGFSGSSSVTGLVNGAQLLITTAAGSGTISGDFAAKDLAGVSGTVSHDFLVLDAYQTRDARNYILGANLAWFAGAARSHGNFTLGAGEVFDINVGLSATTAGSGSPGGWDGQSLTVTAGNRGTFILSASNNYTGTTTVNSGALAITNWTGGNAAGVITGAGAAVAPTVQVTGSGYWGMDGGLAVGVGADPATLAVTDSGSVVAGGTYAQGAAATLDLSLAGALGSRGAFVTAAAFDLAGAGTLAVSTTAAAGFSGSATGILGGYQVLLRATSGSISGDFAAQVLGSGSAAGAHDFIVLDTRLSNDRTEYLLGANLAWFTGTARSHGNFTLSDGETFIVDVSLSDTTQHLGGTNSWDGKSLTLTNGNAGTLVLSASNNYAGDTTVNGGVLEITGWTGSNWSGFIGAHAGDSGTVRVSGTGYWGTAGQFRVGDDGAGALVITGGTVKVSGTHSFIGYAGGATGTVSVSAGLWENSDQLFVGNGGLGHLAVSGGTVSDVDAYLGDDDGHVSGTGHATVSGSGFWHSSGSLTVGRGMGNNATGHLAVSDSGSVSVGGAYAQTVANSTLDLTLTGTLGSRAAFVSAGHATLGSGTLRVTTSATASLDFSTGTAAASTLAAGPAQRLLVTASGITGEFGARVVSGGASTHDFITLDAYQANYDGALGLYRDYLLGAALTWYADPAVSHGNFTLLGGQTFVMDTGLGDVTGGAWDGRSLTVTDSNAGALILSASNNYSGVTTVNGGDLFITGWTGSNTAGVIGAAAGRGGRVSVTGSGYWGLGGGLTVGAGGTGALAVAGSGSVVAGGVYAQDAGAALTLTLDGALGSRGAFVSASAAQLAGTLTVSATGAGTVGFVTTGSASGVLAVSQTLLHTVSGLGGDFAGKTVSGGTGSHDFIVFDAYQSADARDYLLGANLAWFTGTDRSHGTFTLGAGETFTLDVNLSGTDHNADDSWDGATLTKLGAGTLVNTATLQLGGLRVLGGTFVNRGWISDDFYYDNATFVQDSATAYLTATNGIVGDSGSGGFVVSGGTVNVLRTLTFGVAATGHGSGTVSGGLVELTGAGGGDGFYVGAGGTGGLTVTGGTVSGAGRLVFGRDITGAGTGTVSGGLVRAGDLVVGGSGAGRLDITATGSVTAGAGVIGQSGSGGVTVSGSGFLGLNGGLSVGDSGAARLAVTDRGSVRADGAYVQSAGVLDLTLTGTLGARGAFVTAADFTVAGGTLAVTATAAAAPDFSGSSSATALLAGAGSQILLQAVSGSFNDDFARVILDTGANPQTSTHDFLVLALGKSADARQYLLGAGLAWNADPSVSHGSFTLFGGEVFDLNVGLATRAQGTGKGWDGQSLTLTADNRGTLILSATNTYSGSTSVRGGKLAVTGVTGGGAATVFAGGTLVGTGTIGGAVTVSGSGVLSAGDVGTVGKLTVGGLTLSASSVAVFDLAAPSAAWGVNDWLASAGGVVAADGSVISVSGAALNAGDVGTIGKLTVGGLTLSASSVAAFDLTGPSATWGVNDWIASTGGLGAADGSVISISGVSLTKGLYHLISYADGAGYAGLQGTTWALDLAGSGLNANEVYVQTSVSGEINLIYTGSVPTPIVTGTDSPDIGPGGDDGYRALAFTYWDGTVSGSGANRNDGALSGGNGVWESGSNGGNDNWANISGSLNAGWLQTGYAFFGGSASGTVTISNAKGAVSAVGMEFTKAGYVLQGDTLTLIGGSDNALINVDNSGTTTINNNLVGSLPGTLFIAGTGALVFNGMNDYGSTTITNGKLLINGRNSGAVTVKRGILGGTGTISGGVTVSASGIINAGDVGTVGKLTVGSLTLSASSVAAFDLVGPLAVWGVNDWIASTGGVVAADDSIISVSGDNLAIGVYHLISYADAGSYAGLQDTAWVLDLAGSGLNAGDVYVQTSVSGEINLIYTGSVPTPIVTGTDSPDIGPDGPDGYRALAFTYWDGAVSGSGANRNDGALSGGNGVWESGSNGGNDNWANARGLLNAGWLQGGYAFFGGSASGTVSVSNAKGTVSAVGMEFTESGYVLQGDALTLVGGPDNALINLANSGTTTINNNLVGNLPGTLFISGSGALVFNGINDYGSTTITNGKLLVNGRNSGGVAVNRGTLGGTGTISGAVTVSASGIINAGDVGTVGKLTVGSLTLSASSVAAFDLTAPSATWDANDWIASTGGLTAADDSIISVNGNDLTKGLYHLISYADGGSYTGLQGTTWALDLAGSGLAANEVYVQTSVSGEINLIYTGSIPTPIVTGTDSPDIGPGGDDGYRALAFTYWDGTVSGSGANRNDGAHSGGNGVWESGSNGGNDNWANISGSLNAGWLQTGYAFFGGSTSGTVTVDNTKGAVSAVGMEFTKAGYVLQGDALTLVGGPDNALINLANDGTTTINNNLVGNLADTLFITGSGALVFTGSNILGNVSVLGGGLINRGVTEADGDLLVDDTDVASSAAVFVNTAGRFTATNAIVGGAANGLFRMDSGTVSVTDSFVLGRDAVSTGTGTVSGSGVLNITNTLTVGASGTGALVIADSGSVSANDVVIGNASGAFGTVSVGDTGHLDLTGGLTIGGATAATAALTISESGSVNVTGVYSQTTANSTLTLTFSDTFGYRDAFITAQSATLANGALRVIVDGTAAFSGSASGLADNAQRLIHTEDGISGVFATHAIITATSAYDFLVFDAFKSGSTVGAGNLYQDYVLGTQLAWFSGTDRSTGDFTLGSGQTFLIDVSLGDVAPGKDGWDGQTLTVTAGNSGTFILSASNSFSGGANVLGGALVVQRADALGSGTLTVAGGAAAYVSPTTSGNFTLTNTLTGSGLLEINLSAANNQFSIINSQLFTGTASFRTGMYELTDGQFASAGVVSGSGNLLVVGTSAASGRNQTAAFTFNGGAARFDIANSATRANGWIDTGTLTLAAGQVRVDGALVVSNTSVPLVRQDDGVSVLLINSTTNVGDVDALTLSGTDGQPLSPVSGTIMQDGVAAAVGHYDAVLTGTGAAGSGLYLNDVLTRVDLITGATLALTSTAAEGDDFTAEITGTGKLAISASTTLTLTGTNSYSGTTSIEAGAVISSNADALGGSDVVVSSSLILSFDDDSFANDLSGAGEVTISGTGITVSGSNGDFTGTWNVTGSGTMRAPENLGDAGTVNIGGDLSVVLTGTDDFVFAPELTGGGTLTVSNSGAFDFGPDTGGGFTGEVILAHNQFTLDDNNTLVLGDATLTVGEDNHTVVGSGTREIGNLTLDSGTLGFAIDASGTAATGVINTATLTLSGSTYIVVDTGSFNRELPLLQQDELQPIQLIFSSTLVGAAGVIDSEYLRDETGARLTNSTTKAIVQQSATTARGTYDFSATTGNTGLYLSYELLALHLLDGQTTVLDQDIANAVLAGADELHAVVSGSGNLKISASNAIYLNHANSYSGTTFADSGTLILGANGALGETAMLNVSATASVDLGGRTQTVQALESAGALDFNSGTLTVSGSNGNSIVSGTLTGTGALIVQSHTLTVTSGNGALTVDSTINAGAVVIVNNVAGLGTGAVAADGEFIFNGASGTNSNNIGGSGIVSVNNSGNVVLGGTNTAFSGTWQIAADSVLKAITDDSLGGGEVSIDDTGTLTLGGSGTYAVGNFISGSGALVKDDANTVTITGSNSYSGGSVINSGTLRLQNLAGLGSGTVNVAQTSRSVLDLAAPGEYQNHTAGPGTVILSGSGITVTGSNTAFTGTWNVTGSGTVRVEENLGAAAVELAAGGALTLAGDAAWEFNNTLTGSGALVVNLGDAGREFKFTGNTGAGFAGTLLLTSGSYYISDPTSANMTALGHATLTLTDGGIVTLGAADGLAIGNLTLLGGTFNAVMSAPDEIYTLTVNHLSVASGTGTVINLDQSLLPVPPQPPLPPSDINLIDQASGTLSIQVVAATTVDVAGVKLKLELDGAAPESKTYTIDDGHGNTDVAATYNYTVVSSSGDEHPAGAGLYVGYVLQQLQTNSDLVLDTAGATHSSFDAAVTGSGNVEFNARSGTLTLTGSNSYTGVTTLADGTLLVGTDNPLFAASRALVINIGATLDLNGHDTQVNNLTGAGLANFTAATLTVTSDANTVFTGTLNGGVLVKTGAAQLDADAATATLTQVRIDDGELQLGAKAAVSGGNEPAVLLTGGTATFNGSQLTTDRGPLMVATADATVNLNNLTVSATAPGASLARVEQGALTVNLNHSAVAGDIDAASGAGGQVSISGNSALTGRVDGVAVVIDTTSQLNLTGNSSLTGLANHGTVNFVTDGSYDKTLTLGSLTGSGTFSMNVSIQDREHPVSDYLNIEGAASGDHRVIIKRTAEDLKTVAYRFELPMIGIDPNVSDATFHGETDVGMRVATLQLGDLSGRHLDQWFLVLRGGSGSGGGQHGVLASAAMRELAWFDHDTLVKRLGELRLGLGARHGLDPAPDWDVWARGYGAQTNVGGNVSGHSFSVTNYGSDLGADKAWALDQRNTVVTGVFGGYGKTDLDLRANGGHGRGTAYRAGLYATWLHDTGWYADAVLKAERYASDFNAYDASGYMTDGKYHNWTAGASVELGRQFQFADGWFAEPQLQAGYARFLGADYTTGTDNEFDVHQDDRHVIQLRAGAIFGRTIRLGEASVLQPYLKVSGFEQLSTGGRVTTEDGRWNPTLDGPGAAVGAGLIWQLDANNQLHLDYEARFGTRYDSPWSVNAGYRYQF